LKILILTTENQWFVSYAKKLQKKLSCDLLFNHDNINSVYDTVFILSYHQIIPIKNLQKNRHNIVIHASDLPQGKGWAPMFWQILEEKNEIIFSMFEASDGVDNGNIYMKKTLYLSSYELNNELRKKQAEMIIDMCLEFVNNYDKYKTPTPQSGIESFYPKRTSKDSELDIDKTINEQFNLFRIVDNNDYPAFFYKDGKKYILKIEESDENK